MRKQLNKTEIKELNKKISEKYGVEVISKKDKVVVNELIYVNDTPYFFYSKDELIPTLKLILRSNFLKKITVDMGAVKFVVSGADIMRPGIKAFEDVKKDEIVTIVDENNSKPLCIGKMLVDSGELKSAGSGKAVKNLHYIGDDIWEA